VSGKHIVLLDLKQDRYVALDAAEGAVLVNIVSGWPAPPEAALRPFDDAALSAAIDAAESMVEDGLFTRNNVSGRPAAPIQMTPATSSLLTDPFEAWPAVKTRHVIAFVWAVGLTIGELRLLTVEHIVRRFVTRRSAHDPSSARNSPHDINSDESHNLETLRSLVLIFVRLRPFAYRSKNACLLNSMALARFLLYFRIKTRLVFGVQTAPFAAHCWLQVCATVLNDTVDNISAYTPILAV
jgi:hypothetical protein